ncbi:RadC family protein [Jannaschia marina]|uniref:RadC family protein n=1 Tax=Jannaschia marina TaxID=2741674 RepID=UPI0015C72AD9|nr:DNA repair protein RadC [Jannaschia marina]
MNRLAHIRTGGAKGHFAEAPLPDLFGSPPVPVLPVPRRAGTASDHRAAHRARLRERFMQGGAAAMPDYELLELLLFRALPRRDVKPLAKELLQVFGDLSQVMAAPAERLTEVNGAGPAVVEQIKMLEALAHRMARARVIDRPVLSSWDVLLTYLRTALSHQGTERFRVLYLDRRNVLIEDEELAEGTVDHVPVYPREVVKRALALNASALILVHNHPSGDPTPSEADIAMTRRIAEAAGVLGIVLHDHIVIGKGAEVSFRSEGLLDG